MSAVSVTVRDFHDILRVPPARIRAIARAAFAQEGPGRRGEVVICIVGDALIRSLNRRFLAVDSPTDVIAFNLTGRGQALLADIVVSSETAVRAARRYKTAPLDELYLYVAHGVLHLLGYDDKTPRRRSAMNRKANTIVADASR